MTHTTSHCVAMSSDGKVSAEVRGSAFPGVASLTDRRSIVGATYIDFGKIEIFENPI